MDKSDRIVRRLLEADEGDFEALWREAVDQTAAERVLSDDQLLERLKEGVLAYIEWVNAPADPDEPGDGLTEEQLAQLRLDMQQASSFNDVQQILTQHETEPTFLSMVQSGFFL